MNNLQIRKSLNKIKTLSRRTGVHLNVHNSKLHELAKAEKCYDLILGGHSVLTEAEFIDKSGRADIYDLCCDRVFEILCTEEIKDFVMKRYPVREIIPIKTDLFNLKEDWNGG